MEAASQFIADYGWVLVEATGASLFMTCVSCLLAYVIGLPIGVGFHITTENGLHPNKAVNAALGWIINIGRSVPFIIKKSSSSPRCFRSCSKILVIRLFYWLAYWRSLPAGS